MRCVIIVVLTNYRGLNIVSDCDKPLRCKHDVRSVSMHVVMVTSSMLLKCAAIKQSTAGHRILAMFNIVRIK